jgi:hypothetical protein
MRKLVGNDSAVMGGEPTWEDEDETKTSIIRAFNWYNYSFGRKDAKEFIIDYAKAVGRSKDEIALLKSINEAKLQVQVGWLARMFLVGYKPDDRTKTFFANKYKELLADAKNVKQPVVEVAEDVTPAQPVVSIQQRIRDKASEEAGDIEGMVDDFILAGCKNPADLDNYFKAKKLSSVVMKRICEIFIPRSEHLAEVLAGQDKQLVEGYSNFSKVQIRKLKEFYDAVISAANKASVDNKPVRKTKARKEKPATVVAAKVQYLPEFAELNLKSIAPVKVVGVMQAWVYNTKTKMLCVYNAENAKGLSFKGTTFLNYNKETSVGKRLRKPEVTIKDLMEAGKVKLKKVLTDLSTKELQLTGRMNSDTMILRVN